MAGLRGKSVLVTGGNGGIGLAIARSVAHAGADLAIWGRDEAKSEAAAQLLRQAGTKVSAVRCDVSSESDVERAFKETLAALGRVDVLIANAGVARWFTPFPEMTYDQWRETMSTNLDGVFLCVREVARHLVSRGEGGALVAVSSLAAINGAPRGEDYAASKAGLIAMMKGLAVELARHRIRSNVLIVGWTDTEINRPFVDRPGAAEAVVARSPLRRFLQPDELGPAAVFLADPTLVAHTGDIVTVDGAYGIA